MRGQGRSHPLLLGYRISVRTVLTHGHGASDHGIATARVGPRCCDGGAGSREWVLRQSFGAETIAVDEAYRNQTGCGRNRSVAWTRAPVAKTSGTRRRAGADRWHGGGHERSADSEGRVHLVFHLSNGDLTQTIWASKSAAHLDDPHCEPATVLVWVQFRRVLPALLEAIHFRMPAPEGQRRSTESPSSGFTREISVTSMMPFEVRMAIL